MTAAETPGPLTKVVLDYTRLLAELVPTARTPADWAPLAVHVATDDFVRFGTFMEVQDWAQYTEMLTGWASSVDAFASTVHRIGELPGLVYYEIEERHTRGDTLNVVNSLTVFEIDPDRRIRRLHVYLQQAH